MPSWDIRIVLVLAMFIPFNRSVGQVPWSQFQGNAAHTGFVQESPRVTEMVRSWVAPASTLQGTSLFTGGVAMDGQRIYVSQRRTGTIQELVAIDPLSGNRLWGTTMTAGSQVISAPSLDSGQVYVHQYGDSTFGSPPNFPYLKGFNKVTGAQTFATVHSGQFSSGSRPTVIGTQVFALGGIVGGMDGYGTNGASQWFTPLPAQYYNVPAADASRVYLYLGAAGNSPGPQTGTFYALLRSTGAIDYSIQNTTDTLTLFSSMQSVVLDGNGHAYALSRTATRDVVRFNLNTQSVDWRAPIADSTAAMALTSSVLAVAAGNQLLMLDPNNNGQLLWSWNAPGGAAITQNIVLTNNVAFVSVQANNTTYAVDLTTHQTIWSVAMSGDLAYSGEQLIISNASQVAMYAVPEPMTIGLLITALLTATGIYWRVRRQQNNLLNTIVEQE